MSRPVVTAGALAIAVTLGALTTIDRVTEISLGAALAMLALGVVTTWLDTRSWTGHAADTVTIALTRGTRGEVPLLAVTLTRV